MNHSNKFTGFIDQATITCIGNINYLKVFGWILSNEYSWVDLEVSLNGIDYFGIIRIDREDIKKRFSDIPHSFTSGFQTYIPLNDNALHFNQEISLYIKTYLIDGSYFINLINGLVREESEQEKYKSIFDPSDPKILELSYCIQQKNLSVQFNSFIQSNQKLYLSSKSEKPSISICLVCFNKPEYTLACLRSIASQKNVSYEVIIVDNNSNAQTQLFYSRLSGNVKVINLRSNVHFLLGMNTALQACRTDYCLMINNDIILSEGSLSIGLNQLCKDNTIGAIGGKLIRPDGLLQEAGSIIWRDGSTSGYGVGRLPSLPEYNFKREVDYLSGALIFSRTSHLKNIGYLDQRFAPAYYEDTDLCLRMRKLGLKIIYEPCISALHFEGTSSKGTDYSLKLIEKNKSVFRTIHKEYLQNRAEISPFIELFMREPSPRKHRVLYIDDFIPDASMGQGQPRMCAVIEALISMNFNITLFATNQDYSHECEFYKNDFLDFVELFASKEIEQLYELLTKREGYYDFIVVSRPHNIEKISTFYKNFSQKEKPIIIYDSEAIFALREIEKKRICENVDFSEEEISNILSLELEQLNIAEIAVTVSEIEKEILSKNLTCPVIKAGFGCLPKASARHFFERFGIISMGPILSADSPNYFSTDWFLKEIYPSLQSIPYRHIGEIKEEILRKSFSTWRDIFTGKINNLESWLDNSRVFVACHQFCAGIPIKVIEASSYGIPTVITPILAKQLDWKHGLHTMVATSKEEFIEYINLLNSNEELWYKIRANAMKDVLENYSIRKFQEQFSKAFNYFLFK
jgi:GT2 family glycosyltransferase